MKLFIKNMVTIRCRIIVKSVLEDIGIPYSVVELGEVQVNEQIPHDQYVQLQNKLTEYGLELLEDKNSQLIEQIKQTVVEMIHYTDEPPLLNFSEIVSEKMGYDYQYLSSLFSKVKGITIEQFIISHKIEKAKELLIYNKLSLTEIAYKLHYSSVAHLSNQFKKVTGMTPTSFKKMKHPRLKGRGSL